MTPEQLTVRGRQAAERLMVDVCRIERPSDDPVTDPVTGVVSRAVVLVYEGKCKIQQQSWQQLGESQREAGEHFYDVLVPTLHLPISVPAVQTDDRITILTSFDPLNVGRVFRFLSGTRKTYQTSIRVRVAEILS